MKTIKKYNAKEIYQEFLKEQKLSSNTILSSEYMILKLIDFIYQKGYETGDINGYIDGLCDNIENNDDTSSMAVLV
jgi:hypothetical protein